MTAPIAKKNKENKKIARGSDINHSIRLPLFHPVKAIFVITCKKASGNLITKTVILNTARFTKLTQTIQPVIYIKTCVGV